jgi:hypothetical protein
VLKGVDHPRPQAANRRLPERRTRPSTNALVPNGIPNAVNLAAPDSEREPHFLPLERVPDPFDRYAPIIFPVPPPR